MSHRHSVGFISTQVAIACLLSLMIFSLAVSKESDNLETDQVNFMLDEDEELPRSASSMEYHSEIKSVLSGDDFAQEKTVTRRRWIELFDEDEEEESEEALEDQKYASWLINILSFFYKVSSFLGGAAILLEVLLWAAFIGLIVFVVYKYRAQISSWASDIKRDDSEPELPTTLFGLDIQKDSVSDDVVGEAQAYWQSGDRRLAIATLLRSSLITLLHEHQCRFFSSDTEAECCDRIDQQVNTTISVFMRSLVSVWQRVAYAHIEPNKAQFDHLCTQWQEVFG